MRVGLVIYGELDTLSGGFLYDRLLVEYLQKSGDDVQIFSLPWRSYPFRVVDNLSGKLIRAIEAAKLDALLQDELNHPSLFWLNSRLHSRLQLPLIAIVHHLRSSEPGPGWQNRLIRRVERAYLVSVDGFIYNSHTTRKVVERLLPSPRPAVVAYPGGDRLGGSISDSELHNRVWREGPLRLLSVGNVVPRKGLHVLLNALEDLEFEWELRVVGSLDVDRRYATSVRRKVHTAGLDTRVQFLGPIRGQELSGLMVSSHLLVLPSFYEGFGIVYIEGMTFGVPAIGSWAGAAHEIIEHGVNGFLISPGDTAAVRGHLRELHADRGRLFQMSLAALERARRHPSWEQTDARIRDFLLRFVPAELSGREGVITGKVISARAESERRRE